MRVTTCLLLLLFAGCDQIAFKGQPPAPAESAPAWPFVPVVMRVHPFTAFSLDAASGPPVLEVRIELLDRVGDVTKGVGDFRFELYGLHEKASQQGEEERLFQWDASMNTVDENQQHYDPITRTYGFRLKLAAAPPGGQKLKLLVQLTDAGGRRIVASAPLKYGTPKPAAGE
jgi:hypothetical protein